MKNLLLKINLFFSRLAQNPPQAMDMFMLSVFTILITLQPYYLHRVVDYFELAIYLPGINSILNGLIPYKDFFHLRGPLELYIPAFFMHFFGKNISILYTYFYVGTIVTLIIWILIGKQIFKNRMVLYFFTLVLIARTFPRVVFQIWGGIRFGWGAIAILCILCFFNHKKKFWILLAGLTTSLALLTSIEIGIFVLFSLFCLAFISLICRIYSFKEIVKLIQSYLLGLFSILIPYGIYLAATGSLIPFLDSFLSVTHNMAKVFPDYLFEDHPRTLIDALKGLNPTSKYFKHLTPGYCYLFFISLMAFKLKKKTFKEHDLGILAVCFYGFIMYIFAFRKIGAAQFEMALQPEKVLLFFMLDRMYTYFIEKKQNLKLLRTSSSIKRIQKKTTAKIIGINSLLFLFIGSSIGYPVQRMNHRFFAFKYAIAFLSGQDTRKLLPQENLVAADIATAQNLYIPEWQNQDFNQLKQAVNKLLKKDETLFGFPDLGIYNFIVDRPFVGKFPIVIFSWFNYDWADELYKELLKEKPKVVIFPKQIDPVFEKVYFKVQKNKESYDQFFRYIDNNYRQVSETPSLRILLRKSE